MEVLTWIDADGVATPMDDVHGLQVRRNVKGRFTPAHRVTEEIVPGIPGSRMRALVDDVRVQTYPVTFSGVDEADLRDNVRAWAWRMDPTRGPGILLTQGPSGDLRELFCYVTDGLDLDESGGISANGWYQTALTIRSPWPYWLATNPTVEDFAAGTGKPFFPIPPIRLRRSSLFGTQTVTIDGNRGAWPVWQVSGPGSALILTNITTGRRLAWDGTITVGETLTIDTRPPELAGDDVAHTVLLQDGTDEFAHLSAGDFWPLIPGSQVIDVELNGTTDTSRVRLQYQPMWSTV